MTHNHLFRNAVWCSNDRPCCWYSPLFWSLVTSTVCAASFTVQECSVNVNVVIMGQNKVQLDDTCSFPCKQPSSQSGATLSILCWHLADWSTMVPLTFFCHSIPSPIHLGLECWMFLTETLIQMKAVMDNARFLCWSNACWVVGMNSRGLRPTVNISFLASFTEVDLQFLLYISTPDTSSTVSWKWGWLSPGWWQRRCQWPQEKWPMHSMLSFCQFLTLPPLSHTLWMNGRREVPDSNEVPAVKG